MHGPVIRDHQDKDPMIQKIKTACRAGMHTPDYKLKPLLGCPLVTYQKRVIIPKSLREDLVDWYHQNLGHPDPERQFKTMHQILYWLSMESHRLGNVSPTKAHSGKQDYGLLPPRTLKTVNPWDIVHVDLIGPYKNNGYDITMIDQATRWLEVGIQPDEDSRTTAESLIVSGSVGNLAHAKLSTIKDLNSQVINSPAQLRAKPVISKNPQANAICERVHLEILNVIRCYEDVDWTKAVHNAAFAVRASNHSILNVPPGQLTFDQDMISRQ
ncbi:LOW QUALITY PROTEIN: Pol protein [Phytophthora palmivora]|uniref:Pol protein n=1 Tax=Phytophthora palmivora TaxID=4796 RepID=A0A2P4Y8L3_9STRA|nr:LOW QUALITY PROTEIN: Pol protein [Phytophthora palmivora]